MPRCREKPLFLLFGVGLEGVLWIIPIDLYDVPSFDSFPHP
jgi:hypothetical protein